MTTTCTSPAQFSRAQEGVFSSHVEMSTALWILRAVSANKLPDDFSYSMSMSRLLAFDRGDTRQGQMVGANYQGCTNVDGTISQRLCFAHQHTFACPSLRIVAILLQRCFWVAPLPTPKPRLMWVLA